MNKKNIVVITEDSPDNSGTSSLFLHQEHDVRQEHLLTESEVEVLTSALSSKDERLQEKVLVTLSNSSAFTQNQVLYIKFPYLQ